MNIKKQELKTYSAELTFNDKEIIAIPIKYKGSSLKDRKITIDEPQACSIDEAKTRVLLEVSSGKAFKVIVSAKNQKEATESVLNSPLRELEQNNSSLIKCIGLLGGYGVVTSLSKIHEESIESLVDYAKEHLLTSNYGDYLVEEGRAKPKVTSIKELSKLPSKKNGVTYDVSQSGSIVRDCVAYFSYSGANRTQEDGADKIHLKNIKLIQSTDISRENQLGNRVIMAHYKQKAELVERVQVERLSDCDIDGSNVVYSLQRLHSLHANQDSNPNILSKENTKLMKETLINNELQNVENIEVFRDSFVTRKIAKSKELVNEI